MALEKAEKATLTLTPSLNQMLPQVKAGDATASLVFFAEGLKPKEAGKGTSAAEMSSTGVWSERDPREATAEQGRRSTEAFVDAMSASRISGNLRRKNIMSTPAPFAPIAELLERSLSIRHVYGEPVQHGDTTVIPVAKVAYGFGAGGGRAPGRGRKGPLDESPSSREHHADAQGAGGGGGVRMTPVGALEIGPQGTRFVHFHPLAPLLGVAVLGLVVGWLVARRRD